MGKGAGVKGEGGLLGEAKPVNYDKGDDADADDASNSRYLPSAGRSVILGGAHRVCDEEAQENRTCRPEEDKGAGKCACGIVGEDNWYRRRRHLDHGV